MASPDAPSVSVVMAMRDSESTLAPALRSMLHQQAADWELILMDDGSSDASVALAQAFAQPRLRLVVDGRQRGLAERLNQAIDLARGRFIARMDADDVAYPERLAQQLRYLQAHPEVDLVGCGMLVFRGEGSPVGAYPTPALHAEICARPYSGFHLAHPTWVGRVDWFRRWPYDPACAKAQDQDLLLRAYRKSRFAALPQLLMGYRQERVSLQKSFVGRRTFARAVWRDARAERQLAAGAIAVAAQAGKLAYDALALASGLDRVLLRHRASPLPREEAVRWQEVWNDCNPRAHSQPERNPLSKPAPE